MSLRSQALQLNLRNFAADNRILLGLLRTIRIIWLLGPWRGLILRYYRRRDRNKPLPRRENTLFDDLDVAITVSRLDHSGFALGIRLPDEYVDRILKYWRGHGNERTLANPHLDCETIRDIAFDPKVVEIAAQYIGAEPVFYGARLYLTNPPSDEAGMKRLVSLKSRFHYDVGDYITLVVFIYLSDVDEDSGPHIVIESTHKHKSLWRLINRQLPDKEAHFRFASRITVITGPRGTGFFEDVTCFHKHSAGTKTRLMLSITYQLQRSPAGLEMSR